MSPWRWCLKPKSSPREHCSSISTSCRHFPPMCLFQPAQKTVPSTALPATSLRFACEIVMLMLLIDHFKPWSCFKCHLITYLVLWADISSSVLWEGGRRLQGWALQCRCCPGTWQWPFSCPVLLRPSGLATYRGFGFSSPLWEAIPLCWQHSVALCFWSSWPDVQSWGLSGCTGRVQDLLSVLPHVNTMYLPCWDHPCAYLKHSEEGLGEVVKCTPPSLHLIKVKLAPKELHPQEWEDDNEEEEKQQQGGNGADWIQEWSHKVTQGVPVSGRQNRDS